MRAWTKTTTVAHGQTVDIVHRTKVTWKLIARRVVKNVDCCKRAVDLENQILWIKPWVRCLIGHCSLISVKNLHITLRCISAAHRWKTIVSRQSPCYANTPHPLPCQPRPTQEPKQHRITTFILVTVPWNISPLLVHIICSMYKLG